MSIDLSIYGRRVERSARALPRQQQRVLDFIKAEIAAGKPFPRARDIAAHMEWKNTSGTRDVLAALRRKGYLLMRRDGLHELRSDA